MMTMLLLYVYAMAIGVLFGISDGIVDYMMLRFWPHLVTMTWREHFTLKNLFIRFLIVASELTFLLILISIWLFSYHRYNNSSLATSTIIFFGLIFGTVSGSIAAFTEYFLKRFFPIAKNSTKV